MLRLEAEVNGRINEVSDRANKALTQSEKTLRLTNRLLRKPDSIVKAQDEKIKVKLANDEAQREAFNLRLSKLSSKKYKKPKRRILIRQKSLGDKNLFLQELGRVT